MREKDVRKLQKGDEHRDRPTMNHPLNGPRRPVWKPVIVLALVIGALVLFYLFGLSVLVPSG